jgi:xanthine dehydrogenase YagS FAD-binding subunit
MRAFEYATAASVDDAIQALGRDANDSIRLLAGGTDLLTLMKADIIVPEQLIDIKRASELTAGIEETADGLTIGALTSLSDIETHPLVAERYPALAEAAAIAATPQLRNMATVGGNLLQRSRCWYFRSSHFTCWLKGGDECYARGGQNREHALFSDGPCVSAHPSDLATALVALDASVRVRGASGERAIPITEFFAQPTDERRTETTLGHDELILAVQLPATTMTSTYFKAMDRKVWAFALAGVAAALRLEGGTIADARIVLGGVAPIPWRAEEAERVLVGSAPSPTLFERVAEQAVAGAEPLEHNGYKLPLTRALVKRALTALTASA